MEFYQRDKYTELKILYKYSFSLSKMKNTFYDNNHSLANDKIIR